MIKFIYYLLKYKRYCRKHKYCGRCVDCKYHNDEYYWDEVYRARWANQCELQKHLASYFFDYIPCSWEFDKILWDFKGETE